MDKTTSHFYSEGYLIDKKVNCLIEDNIDIFFLEDQRVEVLISEAYLEINTFAYDYAKGYIASFFVN